MKFTIALTLSALALASTAQASVVHFAGNFGAEAAGATGSGSLLLAYDDVAHTLLIDASWSGLSGNTNNAHIHCCTAVPRTGTAGVALATSGLLPGFPLGVKAGTYNRSIDLTNTGNYSGAFVTASGGNAAGAEARLISNLLSGQAYLNIHTTTFGGGEIRAFVSRVPEPAGMGLLALAAAAGVTLRRRQRRG